jgi:hypothetical protein
MNSSGQAAFPVRVGVRPQIILAPEAAVPVKTLTDRPNWSGRVLTRLRWGTKVDDGL